MGSSPVSPTVKGQVSGYPAPSQAGRRRPIARPKREREVVVPSFACTDPGGSAMKKCTGPDKVATQSTGAKVFVVKATDEAGNDGATTIHDTVAS